MADIAATEVTTCERLRQLYRSALQRGDSSAAAELQQVYMGVKLLNRTLNEKTKGPEAVRGNKWFQESFWEQQLAKIAAEVAPPAAGHKPQLQRRHVIEPAAPVEIHSTVGWGRDVKIDTTGGVKIGPHTNITHRATILTHIHAGLTAAPDEVEPFGELVACPLVIGARVFIGESAVIMPQVRTIGDWAVIGAFSVLTKPVGPGEIWAGNPAKFIRMRDGMTRKTELADDC